MVTKDLELEYQQVTNTHSGLVSYDNGAEYGMRGILNFNASTDCAETITSQYDIKIVVPPTYPSELP